MVGWATQTVIWYKKSTFVIYCQSTLHSTPLLSTANLRCTAHLCYLLPIYAAQHASTTPRRNLKSLLFLNDRINGYCTTVKLLANIL